MSWDFALRSVTSWPELWLEVHKLWYSYVNNCGSEGSHLQLSADPQHYDIPDIFYIHLENYKYRFIFPLLHHYSTSV